jgi:hypothetical protein
LPVSSAICLNLKISASFVLHLAIEIILTFYSRARIYPYKAL